MQPLYFQQDYATQSLVSAQSLNTCHGYWENMCETLQGHACTQRGSLGKYVEKHRKQVMVHMQLLICIGYWLLYTKCQQIILKR